MCGGGGVGMGKKWERSMSSGREGKERRRKDTCMYVHAIPAHFMIIHAHICTCTYDVTVVL